MYNEAHFESLQFFLHCRTLDMTLDEVRALLQYRDKPDENCGEVNVLLDEYIDTVETCMEELVQLKQHPPIVVPK